MNKEAGMEYTDWIKPRPFQDDPGFIGKVFAAQNRESGLEEVIYHLATETWINQQMQLSHQLDCSQEAVLDTDKLWFGKRKALEIRILLRAPRAHFLIRLALPSI